LKLDINQPLSGEVDGVPVNGVPVSELLPIGKLPFECLLDVTGKPSKQSRPPSDFAGYLLHLKNLSK
jgi:hypothetical protein